MLQVEAIRIANGSDHYEATNGIFIKLLALIFYDLFELRTALIMYVQSIK